jgi:short-subunit dehydrogenase
MKDLSGKNAIVTGASKGIGRHIAIALARRGVNVALAARSTDALEATRAACEAAGVNAIALTSDITSREDLQRLAAAAQTDLGPIDILVNNAGIEITGSLTDLTFEQIGDVVRTNLLGTITLTKLILPSMLERRAGVVVNVASLAGKAGMPYNSIYSTTKHGLVGFTEALDLELDGTGVRAGAVLPGFVSETGMWADAHDPAPFLLREVPPAKVVAAVFRVIDGAPEAIVSSLPIRPLLALWAAAPALKKPMVKQMGLLRLMRKEAARPGARPQPAATEPAEAATRE